MTRNQRLLLPALLLIACGDDSGAGPPDGAADQRMEDVGSPADSGSDVFTDGAPADLGPESAAIALPEADFFPEGVATDAAGQIYVGSLGRGEVYVVDEDGPRLLVANDGFASIVGLAVDASRGLLWFANTNAADRFAPSEVVAAQLSDGRVVRRIGPPADGAPHFLNDIDVAADGSVYVTDSASPVVWIVPEGEEPLQPFVQDEQFLNPANVAADFPLHLNGVAVTNDQRFIVVTTATPTGSDGTAFCLSPDGAIQPVTLEGDTFGGGDGIAFIDDRTLLTATPQGLFTITLDEACTRGTVAAFETTAPLNVPTTVAVRGTELVVVNSQLDHFSPLFPAFGTPPDLPFTLSLISLPTGETR